MKVQRLLLYLIITAILVVTMMPLASAATPAVLNAAIDAGLAYQATQQNDALGYFEKRVGQVYLVGQTGEAVLAFENNGHFPGGGTMYSGKVEKGLDYLFTQALETPGIGVQTAGDPDTNGDGLGVYINCAGEPLYCTGLSRWQSLAVTHRTDWLQRDPLWARPTREHVLTNMVDYLAWGQNDPSTRELARWMEIWSQPWCKRQLRITMARACHDLCRAMGHQCTCVCQV